MTILEDAPSQQGTAAIRTTIEPLREKLLAHQVYERIGSPDALRRFMGYHVFAVWDFMSLLKALQRRFCGSVVPWLPPAHPAAARLINEIVLGEESDEDGRGGFASHFSLYRRAMREFDADLSGIERFTASLAGGRSVEAALREAAIDEAVQRFVRHTFAVIDSGDDCRIAAAFTFGREDLLPAVFQKIVEQLDAQTGGGLSDFRYYLQRHIDLDGDEHGPMATRLVDELCGTDPNKWAAAAAAATSSLQARLDLWDAVARDLENDRATR